MRTNRINMMCHGWADAKDGMTYDFRKLTICLHDSQAQRDYLTCHQEIDSFCIIYLNKSVDDIKASEAQVLKRFGLAGSVQEWV